VVTDAKGDAVCISWWSDTFEIIQETLFVFPGGLTHSK
jgi:hypothetical protein